MKIRELTNKAENLIEQGENAKQRQKYYQQQVNSARAQVMSAYARLEAAAETDEEGNATGDVYGARAEVYAAQALLESAEAGLVEANRQLEGIQRHKMEAVLEIERYEAVEEGNMSKLAELQNKRFGANANAFMADLAARMNSGEQARLQLLSSMGIVTSAKTFFGEGVTGGLSSAISGESHNSEASEKDDSKSFLGGFFGGKKNDRSRKIYSKNFSGFYIENNGMAGERYFVKGNHYEKFSYFWQNSDQYSHAEAKYMKTISARDIEGIYLNDNEAQDPYLFWNRDKQYEMDSETYFMEVASHIPEVRSRLDAGESADSIRNDSRLKTCYDYYFDSPINVYEVDDYYYFAGAGRHRCMAAQKLGYDIPVKVIGKYERKTSQSEHNIMSTYKRISSNHTIEDDLRKTNPNYSRTDYDSPWNNNCQRCVSAYEARRRGYDVEALPVPKGEDYLPMMHHPDGWPSVYKGAELIDCSAHSGTAAGENVEETVKSWGDNCRGIVRVRWKPENGGGGHVFIVERTNGVTRFIDPQNGEMNAKTYFSLAKGSDVYCMRIDNLDFSDKITQCCKNREEDKND